MKSPAIFARTALLLALAVLLPLQSPAAGTQYEPRLFQKGKDVVWVPSSVELTQRMLDLVKLGPADTLVDLGSGDGVVVILAAKRGARAHGIEFNPDLVALARRNAEREGVADRATFVRGDIFASDFSHATVVSLFLLPELNLRLRPVLLAMRPGTRVVSNTFDMGDWKPDGQVPRWPECESFCTAYSWVVPARVQGAWSLGGGRLELTQKYQELQGTLQAGAGTAPLVDARVNGATIRFAIGDVRYVGEVERDSMSGTTSEGRAWQAIRQPP